MKTFHFWSYQMVPGMEWREDGLERLYLNVEWVESKVKSISSRLPLGGIRNRSVFWVQTVLEVVLDYLWSGTVKERGKGTSLKLGGHRKTMLNISTQLIAMIEIALIILPPYDRFDTIFVSCAGYWIVLFMPHTWSFDIYFPWILSGVSTWIRTTVDMTFRFISHSSWWYLESNWTGMEQDQGHHGCDNTTLFLVIVRSVTFASMDWQLELHTSKKGGGQQLSTSVTQEWLVVSVLMIVWLWRLDHSIVECDGVNVLLRWPRKRKERSVLPRLRGVHNARSIFAKVVGTRGMISTPLIRIISWYFIFVKKLPLYLLGHH